MTEPQRAAEEQPKPPETKAAERDAGLELKPPPALHEEMRADGMDSASVLEDDRSPRSGTRRSRHARCST